MKKSHNLLVIFYSITTSCIDCIEYTIHYITSQYASVDGFLLNKELCMHCCHVNDEHVECMNNASFKCVEHD